VTEAPHLPRSSRRFWQAVALCTIVLSLLAAWSVSDALSGYRVDLLRSKWALLYAGLFLAMGLSVWLLVQLRRGRTVRFVAWVEKLAGAGPAAKFLAILSIPAAFGLYFLVENTIFKERIALAGMLWVFWLLSLLAGLALKAAFGGPAAEMLALPILVQGVAFRVLSFVPDISTCPVSLGWSEASRYYYASLPFAQRLYGERLPLSILHPSRYFLQAIPFLIPGTPLWAHRLWQVLLWLGMTTITSVLLVWRLRLGRPLLAALLAMWFFLYLFQGAVYYHLQICIWIILIGVRPGRPPSRAGMPALPARTAWRSLLAVVLASAWAGMSRVNWFPVPAILAAAVYFLETATRSKGGWPRYLLKPVIWFAAGLAAAFASQALYIYWSGNSGNTAAFGSSFTSDLLWYRLWPNLTFGPGILLAILFASLPVMAIIGQYALTKGHALHPVRWLALGGMLAALFAGGLVVSVKIGGGGDLHNMDAFLTLLGIIGAYLFLDRAAADGDAIPFAPYYALALFALTVPLIFAISSYRPQGAVSCVNPSRDLAQLRKVVQPVAKQGGEVLFIGQRQLLTFGNITGVPLVADYEKLILNEMAISGNQAYLDRFYDDLHNHRFAMIVAPEHGFPSDTFEQFSEEDSRWVKRIDAYLQCEYTSQAVLPRLGVEILVPREDGSVCP
jgi:hypothetical protein